VVRQHRDIPAKVALGDVGADELAAPGLPTGQVWEPLEAPGNAGWVIAGTPILGAGGQVVLAKIIIAEAKELAAHS
jgi:hypothetical protein